MIAAADFYRVDAKSSETETGSVKSRKLSVLHVCQMSKVKFMWCILVKNL